MLRLKRYDDFGKNASYLTIPPESRNIVFTEF